MFVLFFFYKSERVVFFFFFCFWIGFWFLDLRKRRRAVVVAVAAVAATVGSRSGLLVDFLVLRSGFVVGFIHYCRCGSCGGFAVVGSWWQRCQLLLVDETWRDRIE